MTRLVWIFIAASAPLLADGGMVVLHREAPPFVVTVFASPTPPRAGIADLSILVQTNDTLEPILDADVHLKLTKSDSQIQVQATRDQSQNKLLYAASVHLDDPGEWRYIVSVHSARSPPTHVAISGVLAVAAESPKLAAYCGYLALPFLCLAIFTLHQRLRWSNRGKLVDGSSRAFNGGSYVS